LEIEELNASDWIYVHDSVEQEVKKRGSADEFSFGVEM